MESDTIVAIVTPPGEGGVGIVRASGPLSTVLPGQLFPGVRSPWKSHHMRFGAVVDPRSDSKIDDALGVVMLSPRSYTGEHVFEIQSHGSPLVLEHIMRTLLELGCRAARPGEFTLRAFLNHRLDLAQAEAVMDVVRAPTNAALELAVRQLSGWLSGRIEPVRGELVGVLAHMEAMVDFVEDDIPAQLDHSTTERIRRVAHVVEALLAGTAGGIILREGATLAIVGSPNVGKSSIMNGLLGSDRSIVTPIAGTTRDTVEERIDIRGIPFRTVDTAGITTTDDLVEQIGVQRSRQALQSADVVLLVLDGSRAWSAGDDLVLEIIEHWRDSFHGPLRPLVIALNKSDLPSVSIPDTVLNRLTPYTLVASNAVHHDGLNALCDALAECALGGPRGEFTAANARHQAALQRAVDALGAALYGLQAGVPLDLLSFDVRAAAMALGEITGADVDDELLDRIFREFCIGK